jgi:ATP-dependent protease ClpP protease subunit
VDTVVNKTAKTKSSMEEMFFSNRVLEAIKLKEASKNRTVYVTDEIDSDTALEVRYFLNKIVMADELEGVKQEDLEPITILINSPGGDVYASFSIISTIKTLQRKGYQINTSALGMAMSGAFKIFIVGSHRVCQENTHFLCHQPHSFEYGTATYIDKEREAAVTKLMWQRLQDIIIAHTNITQEELTDITEKNKDWYFWANEALERNIADEII